MRIDPRRRSVGVSPLIATIILIAITIVGGVLVYTILTGYISRYSGSDQVTVSSIQLSVAPTVGTDNGPALLSISVKDTGTTDVTCMDILLVNGSAAPTLSPVSTSNDFQCDEGQGPLNPTLDPGLSVSSTYYLYCNSTTPSSSCSGGSPSLYEVLLDGTYEYQLHAVFSDGSTFDTSGTVLASS